MGDYDLQKLQKPDDPEQVIKILAKAACSKSPQVEAHRADLDKARKDWGPKYGLSTDADWADVLVWDNNPSFNMDIELTSRTFATLTPIDQWQLIDRGTEKVTGTSMADSIYLADALDANLTEVGRFALIRDCLKDGSVTSDDYDTVKWAVCQYDLDKFDLAKFYEQVRSDTAHDGNARMWMRRKVHDLPKELKEYAEKKAKLIKKDDEYGKVFVAAAKGREEWLKTIGKNTKLLETVAAVESGFFFHSRKQMDGCEEKTNAALAEAASTIPAKAFTGMHDIRENVETSFGQKAAPLLSKNPQVFLAAIGYMECHMGNGTTEVLGHAMYGAPGFRGPRTAAIDAVMATTFKFDDMNKKGLDYPDLRTRPYIPASLTTADTTGGTVKSIKKNAKSITVTFETSTMKQEDCVKEHRGRLAAIRSSGSLEYEMICDKTAIVTHDNTYPPREVGLAYEKLLKPGVVISTRGHDHGPDDVIATWPSANAKLPNTVLGGTVK